MAVTASSAFPGFFPPLLLTGADVGAKTGEFGRQVYTDGGVFDNLGVRMFRCLEPLLAESDKLDAVLVSDVGKPIDVQSRPAPGGGLIRATLRATDILMDRVWQLEKETFHDAPGFVFAPITEVVEPAEDATALHVEIQRQVANIRTDLDRFSPLEISGLIKHGYCVGRKVCRAHPDLFGADLPRDAPWDPMARPSGASAPAAAITSLLHHVQAGNGPRATSRPGHPGSERKLQASAIRRIWSTLLDYRDWVSYIYVPILVPLFFLVPYLVVTSYQRSARLSHLVESLSQGSHDLSVMSRLLEGPMTPWIGETAEEVRGVSEPDFKGFEILQDSRIIDMRAWNPAITAKNDADSLVYGYRRVKILKRPDNSGNNLFRINILATHPKSQLRFPLQEVQPKLRMMSVDSTVPGEKKTRWEASVDLTKVPAGDVIDLIYEHLSPGQFLQRGAGSTSIAFQTQVDTAEVTRWFMLPSGKEYRSYRICRWETGKPDKVEPVKVVNEYLADDSTILAYKLVSVKAGYTHEITWFYK